MTGKPTMTQTVIKHFLENKLQIKCGASTGVAAASMGIPSATTLHTGWHVPTNQNQEGMQSSEPNWHIPLLSSHLKNLKETFQKSIENGLPFTTFLDEICMISCIVLGHIVYQNCLIHPEVEPAFVLIGDPFQIPPTGATPFYESMLCIFVEQNPSSTTSPEQIGANLLLKTRLIQLSAQNCSERCHSFQEY